MKEIVITGATRGIGEAIMVVLLSEGYKIHAVSRHSEEIENNHGKELKTGVIVHHKVDISNQTELEYFLKTWKGKIYGLINNAGTWAEEKIDDPETGIWKRIINLNLNGAYYLTKGLLPFITQPGRIINISSQLGTMGRIGFGAYCASKHAILGLTKCWALELSKKGILVNAICPGWVNTQSNLEDLKVLSSKTGKTVELLYHEIAGKLILGRFIETKEVANLVTFLISPKSSGISGKIYDIK
jgi:NAD(P)-dependent dehydrogenase (short-subunit alcohol dehydrogenase family)